MVHFIDAGVGDIRMCPYLSLTGAQTSPVELRQEIGLIAVPCAKGKCEWYNDSTGRCAIHDGYFIFGPKKGKPKS